MRVRVLGCVCACAGRRGSTRARNTGKHMLADRGEARRILCSYHHVGGSLHLHHRCRRVGATARYCLRCNTKRSKLSRHVPREWRRRRNTRAWCRTPSPVWCRPPAPRPETHTKATTKIRQHHTCHSPPTRQRTHPGGRSTGRRR